MPRPCSECIFCCGMFGDQETEALMCGHIFHTQCLNNDIASSGESKARCCPYRCHVNAPISFADVEQVVIDADGETQVVESAEPPAARASDADAALANDARNDATQFFGAWAF